MIYSPLILSLMLVFFLVTFIFLPLLWFGVVGKAYILLGLSPDMVFWLLILTLAGSLVNLPLTTLKSRKVMAQQIITYFGMKVRLPSARLRKRTVIAVNVGGALLSSGLSLYVFVKIMDKIGGSWGLLAVLGIVTVVMHHLDRPVRGWALRCRGWRRPSWRPWEPGSCALRSFGPPAPILTAPWGLLSGLIFSTYEKLPNWEAR